MREPKIPCPHCDRLCVGRSGVYMHITAKHGGEGKEAYRHNQAQHDRGGEAKP